MCKFNCLCPCVAVPVTAKEGEGEPSSQVKGVWDSVVSWMKMAVDFIALDSTTESLPGGAPHGKASKAAVRIITACHWTKSVQMTDHLAR